MMRGTGLFYLCMFISVAGFSQNKPLNTDRPGFTDAYNTVERAGLQFETGMFVNTGRVPGNTVSHVNWNTSALRFGVFERTELRLLGGVNQTFMENGARASTPVSIQDPRFGLKTELLSGYDVIPSIAFSSHVRIPIDSGSLRPDMGLIFHHQVDPNFSVSYMLNLDWWQMEQTTLNWTFKITYGESNFSLFAEMYGSRNDLQSFQALDIGSTLEWKKDLQFDVGAGIGMSREAPDWYASIGLSFLLRNLYKVEDEL